MPGHRPPGPRHQPEFLVRRVGRDGRGGAAGGPRGARRRLAEAELAAGRTETARLAFFRAASYDRTAGVMLLGAPVDDRLIAAYARQTTSFRRGAELLARPPEVVSIPYEDTTLPGYLFRCSDE